MKYNFLVLALILGVAFTYTAYDDYKLRGRGEEKTSAVEASADTQQIPDFTFQDLTGKSYALHDLKGKAVVLNFWASWCAPCVVELPQMLKLSQDTKADAVFIFLSIDENREDISKFLKKYKIATEYKNVFIGWDEGKKISQDLFQTVKVPETFLINPDLSIREKIIGNSVSWNSAQMRGKIRDMGK